MMLPKKGPQKKGEHIILMVRDWTKKEGDLSRPSMYMKN